MHGHGASLIRLGTRDASGWELVLLTPIWAQEGVVWRMYTDDVCKLQLNILQIISGS